MPFACRRAALFALLVCAVPAPAASLDAQPRDPYVWRVVLHTGTHPVFTPAYRAMIGGEVRAALQGAVGPAAQVVLFDLAAVKPAEAGPVAALYAEKGWPGLEADQARVITGVKTHVLKVDYRDGLFHLEARQHDGDTAILSPVLRKRVVRAADQVGRVAGLMMEPDFGPVGTVEIIPGDPEYVTVTFRGHAAGPLDRFLKLGDVFAASVLRDPVRPRGQDASVPLGPTTGNPHEYTLLRLTDPIKDGKSKCQVLTSFRNPFGRDARKAAAIRCLKLPTQTAPVTVRLVGKDGLPNTKGTIVQVAATDTDFNARPGAGDAFEFRDGVYRSARGYTNVACVQIALGAANPVFFPIPVLSDGPVTIKYTVSLEGEAQAIFEKESSGLSARVMDALTAQTALFTEVSRLIDNYQNKEALARAEAGYESNGKLEKSLGEELKLLKEDPQAQKPVAKSILETASKRLEAITLGQQALNKRLVDLRDAVKKAASPLVVAKELHEKDLANRIKEYVDRGDIDAALLAYDQLIVLRDKDQIIKDQREKLQGEWATKDDEHQKARLAVKQWEKAKTLGDFKDAVAGLTSAAEVFLRKKDKLGLRWLILKMEPAFVSLKALVDAADTNTEDGTITIADVEKITAQARETDVNAREFLKRLMGQ